ncbi:MAG TPA: hypothetical protein VGF55_09290 [Gemmataceae bacterium]|jgi:hypothetical protein
MRKRRAVVAVLLALLIMAIVLVLWPWSVVTRTPNADVSLIFVVLDAVTHAPVPSAHIAVHDETGVVTILRTDAVGTAGMTRRANVTVRERTNPFTGLRTELDRIAVLPDWQIVVTAKGYQPEEPWRLADRFPPTAEYATSPIMLRIRIELAPQSGTPES